MQPWELGVRAAAEAIAAGDLTPADLAEACLRRCAAVEPAVGAWESLDADLAREAARTAQAGPLHGVPLGVKDVFNTREHPTGMGSPLWAGFRPGNDARAVFNARRAGGVVLGKTVTAEFAVHAPGRTRNPHDLGRSPGTSSSGSAAAVAAGMVPWALGTQTAGSVVRPASYCGIYGFKPSYGLIPRTGMLKTTDTLDSVGVLCRDPGGLRLLLEALRLHGSDHPLVHATLDAPRAPLGRPRVGILAGGLGELWRSADPGARAAVDGFASRMADAGADVAEVTPPRGLLGAHAVHATLYERCLAYYLRDEAASDEVSAGFAALAGRGGRIPLEAYAAALERQEALRGVHDAWMDAYDAVVALSTAGTAPAWGDDDRDDSALIWTLVGAPVVGAPLPGGADGMPLGVQLVGRRRHDHALLDVVDWLVDRDVLAEAPVAQPPVDAGMPLLSR